VPPIFTRAPLNATEPLSAVAVFQIAETVVTVDAILLAIFAKYAWRWRIFAHWLVCVPVLQKNWRGSITPINSRGEIAAAIAATLEVRQTLFDIACSVRTAETMSRSFAAGIFVDPDSGEQRLTYSYSADPSLRTRDGNPRHDGTAVMTFATTPAANLTGTYWTDRLTRGELHFEAVQAGLIVETPLFQL
jgi:hypothetical protein